ncbi:MAG: LysE family translocator [Gammaproteobacteria bacterium]|nr:MAG: LysE family translocator [Gammaproteobacteria bacterium]UCH38753.1 MAG: LysE family translocator [Gammaproteobacteria bacterium]
MDLNAFALLVIACLAVNLSPGPSVLLVSSVSAAHGFRAGLLAVLGMTAGAFVHVVLAASGVAAILAAAPIAFALVQYLGAAYLIYLGIDLCRKKPVKSGETRYRDVGDDWHYFRRGLLVDSLNPKIALFFLAFIPQFLNSVATPGFAVSLMLGSVFLVTGAIVNGSIAWLVAAGVNQTRGFFGEWLQRWIPASVLIYLGLRLLWQEN